MNCQLTLVPRIFIARAIVFCTFFSPKGTRGTALVKLEGLFIFIFLRNLDFQISVGSVQHQRYLYIAKKSDKLVHTRCWVRISNFHYGKSALPFVKFKKFALFRDENNRWGPYRPYGLWKLESVHVEQLIYLLAFQCSCLKPCAIWCGMYRQVLCLLEIILVPHQLNLISSQSHILSQNVRNYKLCHSMWYILSLSIDLRASQSSSVFWYIYFVLSLVLLVMAISTLCTKHH